MPQFETFYEDDEGREIECRVTYTYFPGTPATPYTDPPCGEDAAELEITEVVRKPSEFCEWSDACPVEVGEYGYTEEEHQKHRAQCLEDDKAIQDNKHQ